MSGVPQARNACDAGTGARTSGNILNTRRCVGAAWRGSSRVFWQPYYTVWAVLALTWTSSYMVPIALAPLLRPLGEAFELTYAQAGFLGTAYFYGYAAV